MAVDVRPVGQPGKQLVVVPGEFFGQRSGPRGR
jgi:hypothetical protein